MDDEKTPTPRKKNYNQKFSGRYVKRLDDKIADLEKQLSETKSAAVQNNRKAEHWKSQSDEFHKKYDETVRRMVSSSDEQGNHIGQLESVIAQVYHLAMLFSKPNSTITGGNHLAGIVQGFLGAYIDQQKRQPDDAHDLATQYVKLTPEQELENVRKMFGRGPAHRGV